MPIQVQTTGSINKVEREIAALEEQYGISTSEFLAHPCVDDAVSEFDAIEWHFLLMQKRAYFEDRCVSTSVFLGRQVTETATVDVAEMYESIAA